VSADWGVHAYLLNVDERTFGFVGDVLAEVMELFPGRYIHVGGDEAIKNQWKASPQVQARMRQLGIANEDALQGYFMQRLEILLAAHGRKLVGWTRSSTPACRRMPPSCPGAAAGCRRGRARRP